MSLSLTEGRTIMLQERIYDLIRNKQYHQLKDLLEKQMPADIADMLEGMNLKETRLIFRMLSKELAADVFSLVSPDVQTTIYELVNESELEELLDELQFDDMIDFLEEMPANVVKRIIRNATKSDRELINQFLNYPEDSAGSLMTIEFVALKKEMTAKQALQKIKATAKDKETIYTCYATDSRRELEGVVTLESLVLAKDEACVADLLKKEFISVNTHADQEEVSEKFKKYDLLSMPVVDYEKRLVGIITIDDVVDVIEEENTEDIYRMAAMETNDDSYLDTGVFELAKKRFVWLLFLMLSATLSAAVVNRYQFVIEAVVSLSAFMPMIMGTGGNAGAQTSTTIIRSLSLGEIEFKDIFKIIWKEVRVSLLVGLGLSVLNFLRLIYLSKQSIAMAATVSISLIGTVIFAKLVGAILPMIAQKIKIDPALMASPLITTIVDATSLTIYFSIAIALFNIL